MSLKLIIEEFEKLKGQFVITPKNTVERLVAVGTDDEDYYWITFNKVMLSWTTCCVKIIPLKGKLEEIDYKNLEPGWEQPIEVVLTGTDKILTEIVWKEQLEH